MADTCSYPLLIYVFQPCLPQAGSRIHCFLLPGGHTVHRKNMPPKQELVAALLVLGVTMEAEWQLVVLLA